MPFKIPGLGMEPKEVKAWIDEQLKDQVIQKRCVLVIVSVALLLDNMLYMVIVPIIPTFLREIGVYDPGPCLERRDGKPPTGKEVQGDGTCHTFQYPDEDMYNGYLFASKAAIQMFINPISGTVIDRIGYEIPMVIGLSIMFGSTIMFSLGNGYWSLLAARTLQGVGSAFADTSGLAMIADRFKEEGERSKALGIALAFISFGSLVAPAFGGTIYQHAGKFLPFLLLALVCLLDAFVVWYVIRPKRKVNENASGEEIKGTPIHRLLMDPYIAICAGALVSANISLAFLEPTLTNYVEDRWKRDGIDASDAGDIWFFGFFPHVFGVFITIVLMRRYPNTSWLIAAVGLSLEGFSCLIIPFINSFWYLCIPIGILCVGIAMIDTSLLPLLGFFVDTRHAAVYGSVYAIADTSYSIAYAMGPVVGGKILEKWGFTGLNLFIFVVNIIYVPMFYFLKKVYTYDQFAGEAEMGHEKLEDDDEMAALNAAPKQQSHEYAKAAYGAMADTDTQMAAKAKGYGYGDDAPTSFGIPENISNRFK